LLAHLADRSIGATGTIRQNHTENCPVRNDSTLDKAAHGTTKSYLEPGDNIVVVAWRDNKTVTLASNSASAEPKGTVSRWCRQQRKRINISQPNIIHVYNSTMGGVDRADQHVSLYRISLRTKKWWSPLFAYAVDLMMQNAWLLYRRTPSYQERPLDLLSFRREVVRVYLACSSQPARLGRPGRPQPLCQRVPTDVRFDNQSHYFADSKTQRRCAHCGKNTRKTCSKCNVGLHMHCFKQLHGIDD